MHPCTMGVPLPPAPALRRRDRMDAHQQALATEERLRRQFLAAQAGDAALYRQFLGALATHLRAYFRRRMTQQPDDVEDLVQETLLAIHGSRHTYRAGQPLTAWVHTIARYKFVDFLRARSRREALNDPLDDELAIFASADTDAADARRDIERMLQRGRGLGAADVLAEARAAGGRGPRRLPAGLAAGAPGPPHRRGRRRRRAALLLGDTWRECLLGIPLLAVPAFVLAFWALRGLAPTRLAAAGAAAGLFAGAAAAFGYALHCPELEAPFLGAWYVLGMLIPTAIGALLGQRWLRW